MSCIERTMKPGTDGRPLRVLIVEDCADTADSLAMLVRLWGYEATVAYCGETALAVAAERAPDVVFLDVGLPDVTGLELAPRLRRVPGVAGAMIVVISGFGRPADRARCYEVGCNAFLLKPVDPDYVRRLLAERQREGQ
jgi:CheY-like chemotaxis protein